MKVYIDNDSLMIVKIEQERVFYQGSNYTDKVRLLFSELPTNWAPAMFYLLSNGRKIGPTYSAALNEGESRLIQINGSNYYYFDFILSTKEGMLAVPGTLQMTIAVDYTNESGSVIGRSIVGTVVNQVIKTGIVVDTPSTVVVALTQDEIDKLTS